MNIKVQILAESQNFNIVGEGGWDLLSLWGE